MKFSTRTRVNAPADEVFRAFADFDALADRARARGAEVDRIDGGMGGGPGATYRVRFTHNGRRRELVADVLKSDPPRGYSCGLSVGGLDGTLDVEIDPANGAASEVRVAVELRPTTISARILLKSLKLAKGRLNERFGSGVAAFASRIGKPG